MSLIPPTPNSFPGGGSFVEASADIDRPAEVIVVKQIKVDSSSTLNATMDTFKAKHKEFLQASTASLFDVVKESLVGVLTQKKISKEIVLEPFIIPFSNVPAGALATGKFVFSGVALDDQGRPSLAGSNLLYVNSRYLHIHILPIVDVTKPSYIVVSKSNPMYGVTDVLSIEAELGVYAANTASMTIKNDLKKYEFVEDKVLKGKTIFDPDDIVVIRLPGIDFSTKKGSDIETALETAWTGFINDVDVMDAPAEHTISLTCEGPKKRLRFTRTLIGQALISDDADAAMIPLSAFKFPFVGKSDGTTPDIILKMAVRSITKIYDDPTLSDLVKTFNEAYKKGNSITEDNIPQARTNFNAIEETRGKIESQLDALTKKFVEPVVNATTRALTPNYRVYLNDKTFGEVAAKKLPAMEITGTAQPAFVAMFNGGWEHWVAEFKQTDRIIGEMADNINFVFYESEEGTIRFEQLNVSLDHLKPDSSTLKGVVSQLDTRVTDRSLKTRSASYIRPMWVRDGSYKDAGSDVYNIIVVTAKMDILADNYAQNTGTIATIKDNKLIKKFGPRQMNTISVPSLTTRDSCRAYGRAYLERVNRKAVGTAKVNMMGNAYLKVGRYCYVEEKNRLYYVEGIRHRYDSGKSYTMSLSLSYKREPIVRVDKESAPNYFSSLGNTSSAFAGLTRDSDTAFYAIKDGFDKVAANTKWLSSTNPGVAASAASVLTAAEKALIDLGYTIEEIQAMYKLDSIQDFYYGGFIWEHTVTTDFSQWTYDANQARKANEEKIKNAERTQLNQRGGKEQLSGVLQPGA